MRPLTLLVFVGTEGKYHDHVGHGKYLVDVLSAARGIAADFSQDCEILAGGLGMYDTVLFYTDVGTLTDAQEDGLLGFIRQGGGFFGLHTADASFQDRSGYHAMLNAFFDGHSRYMDFDVTIKDADHPITRGSSDFGVTDELHQWFVPGRVADVRDLTADAAGALVGVGLVWACGIVLSIRQRR